MAKWKLKEKIDIPYSLKDTNLSETILKLLVLRGIDKQEDVRFFLNPDYDRDMHDPFLFVQMGNVVERIRQAKESGEKVAIFGDYDADGITSSVIIKETLDELGVENLVYIPDKKTEGYGINTGAIDYFLEKGVKLIISVDCGITNIKEIAYANEKSINVIVVDHHHVPEAIPAALAIINPHMEGSGYPFRELAGVGVAFKVVQAVYDRLLAEKKEQTKWMLDLVAIGTIADCVPLVDENRIIAKYGMIVLSKTRRIGLRELCTVGRINVESGVSDTQKISFHVAPRINAAGRIDHANVAFELLSEQDVPRARELALEIEGHNQKRQKITEQVAGEVRVLADNMFKDSKLIFAVGEHFPVGVVGLVAGKIAQEYNKPVVILQKGEKVSVGSLRSIPIVNIVESLGKCSDHLVKFGGHAQAAGITVANENIESLHKALSEIVEKEIGENDITPEIAIDLKVDPADIDFDLLDALEKLRPFGEGNREPIFLTENLVVDESRIVGNGNKHLKLKLRAQDGTPKIFDAISFNGMKKLPLLSAGMEVNAVFSLQKDEWNGNSKIQMNIVDIKIH
jgi:single-stranded-DNA-specific exonuclease